jgi:hypothetical protein
MGPDVVRKGETGRGIGRGIGGSCKFTGCLFLNPLPCLTCGTEVLLRGMLVFGNREAWIDGAEGFLIIITTGEL